MTIKQLATEFADNSDGCCLPEQSVLYTNLSAQEIEQLDQIANPVHLDPHQYLLHQHSEAKTVYCLVSGALIVERITSIGQRQVLSFLFPGDFLGYTHNKYFEFSIQSLTKATIVAYQRKDFVDMANTIPTLKDNIDIISNNIISRYLDQIFALGQKKADERVCFLLYQLLRRMPGASEQSLDLPMTRQDIADYLGLTIETVSRAFTKLSERGIIAVSNIYHLEILDPDTLEQLAIAE